jgi:hypothetical protein
MGPTFEHVWGEVTAQQDPETGDWTLTRGSDQHIKILSAHEFERLYFPTNKVSRKVYAERLKADDLPDQEETDADGLVPGAGSGNGVADEQPGSGEHGDPDHS